MSENHRAFPADFVWGAATSAYQIEGAVAEDGRVPSIWDTFSHTPGKVANGDTGDVAADHYHRLDEDIALMVDLGIPAYGFTVAWPRVMSAPGVANEAGLDFYDRLVDGLLEAGIEPYPTLYHWDLPQYLQDAGGWPARATAEHFADYATVVAERLGDRVREWATINEPWVVAHLGYLTGDHAPGHRDLDEYLAASHHLLLAHGLSVDRIRAASPGAEVGIILDFEPKHAASEHPYDRKAAWLAHAKMNAWFLDPLQGRGYPTIAVDDFGWDQAEVLEGDLEIVSRPTDFLGVNYYTREIIDAVGKPTKEASDRRTSMDWEVYPGGIYEILSWITKEYGIEKLYVTENGSAYDDTSDEPPFDDPERIAFLRDHLTMAAKAMETGVPLKGYFVWSLLDNFEWSFGYDKRFGIIRVDYETQERTMRSSARWYKQLMNTGSIPPA
jgi:beta-glucosidase